jgi:hypothetical protein
VNCRPSMRYGRPVPPPPPTWLKARREHSWAEAHRPSTSLGAAVGYAIRGMSVLPCRARGKEPLTEHGFKDASTNTEVIRGLWKLWPEANIAIRTGRTSRVLVVDVDPRNGGNESLAVLEKNNSALPADYVVETSDGGRHFYFRHPDGIVIPCGVLAEGIDIKCENGYVIAPPSVHPSGHRYRFMSHGDLRTVPEWLLAQLAQRAGAQAHPHGDATIDVDELRVSDDIKRLIREGVPKGRRSEAVFGVLRSMVINGHSDDEIIAAMLNPEYGISEKPRENGLVWLQGEIARARVKPGRDGERRAREDDSASSDSNQAGDHSGNQRAGTDDASSTTGSSKKTKKSKARFKLLSVDDLKRMPPPAWLLLDMLVAGSLAVMYGPPGVGKSFLALDLALSIATNHQGVAAPIACGTVVYIAAEGYGGLRNRVLAWERVHNRVAENICFVTEAVNLLDESDTDQLIETLRNLTVAPCLIVIDTMARCMSGGDENSAKDVGTFVSMADALKTAFRGCTVLVLHHGTKSNPKTERGSGALRGAADTMLYLESEHGSPRLSCEKQKDAAPFDPQHLRLESIELDDGETSCVMRSDGGDANGPGTSSNEHGKAILEILKAAGECTYTDLKDTFIADTKLSKRTFDRALKKLVEAGAIKKKDAEKYVLA